MNPTSHPSRTRGMRAMLSGALAVAALATACGGGDRADTIAPPPTQAPLSTASRVATPTASAQPTATSEPEVDAGVLSRVMWELSDMPSGWSAGDPGDGTDDEDNFCGVNVSQQSKNKASVTFGQSAFGPLAVQSAALYTVGDAKKSMDTVRDGFKKCGSSWTSADNPPQTWTVAPLSFPKIGDETFTVRLTTTEIPLFGSAQIDLVFFRRGPVTEVLGYITFGPAVAVPGPLEALANKADEKLVKAGIK